MHCYFALNLRNSHWTHRNLVISPSTSKPSSCTHNIKQRISNKIYSIPGVDLQHKTSDFCTVWFEGTISIHQNGNAFELTNIDKHFLYYYYTMWLINQLFYQIQYLWFILDHFNFIILKRVILNNQRLQKIFFKYWL